MTVLQPGTTLGSYEILSSLGAGGMGEVYRARDTELGREVAVKLLRSEASAGGAADPDALARFEREAKTLASLNHPNVATLHGFFRGRPEPDGADELPFLVMELVPGDTLAERIARGPLEPSDALAVFRQIADGLDAAHEAGIVHRDLKPANVKITGEEAGELHVKVLDFGLARTQGSGPDNASSLSLSPTLTAGATQAGVLLGTAAYMSPEQIRGQVAGRRADVWAAGVVLWEMLTGSTPFRGETVTDLLAASLKEEPDWSELPEDLAPEIRWVLERCLEKRARRRLASLGDAVLLLDRPPTGISADGSATSGNEEPSSGSSSRRSAVLAVAVFLVLVAGLAIGRWSARSEDDERRPLRRVSIDAHPLAYNSWSSNLSFSPDGQRLVYEGEDGLWVHDLSQPAATLIPIRGREPVLSLDGRWLAYRKRAGRTLEKLLLDGGTPTVAMEGLSITNQASWGTDGAIYVGARIGGRGGLFRTGEDPSSPELVVPGMGGGSDGASDAPTNPFAEILPGGEWFLATVFDGTVRDFQNRAVGLIRRADASFVTLLESASQARYSATGHLVFVSEPGTLSAVGFDVDTLELVGTPRKLVANVRGSHEGFNYSFALSQEGSLAYVEADSPDADAEGRATDLVRLGPDWSTEPLGTERLRYRGFRVSPDGRFVIAQVTTPERPLQPDVWLIDLDNVRLERTAHSTFCESASCREPIWLPDSRSYLFGVTGGRVEASRLTRASITSSEIEVVLDGLPGWADLTPGGVLADGETIVYAARLESGDADLFLLRPGADPRVIFSTSHWEREPRVSPDGRRLAFTSDRTGQREVFVADLEDLERPALQISNGESIRPRWSSDGRRVYFEQDRGIHAVDLQISPDRFTTTEPRAVCPDFALGGEFEPLPGDQGFLAIPGLERAETDRIRILENWPALLEPR